jgi:hypothetical protein
VCVCVCVFLLVSASNWRIWSPDIAVAMARSVSDVVVTVVRRGWRKHVDAIVVHSFEP